MNAITFFRIAHYCENRNIPLIPKLMKLITFVLCNTIVPATCIIGKDSRFMYGGIGCVIHAKAIIGDRVSLGQGITIGRSLKDSCPVIGNDVYIGAGARVLGNITIGNNVLIGANAVVITDIPTNSIVAGVPAKVIKTIDNSIWEVLGDIL